ncbi:MAG: small basic protein [Phycisphaerae bacterium]|nr:small basic protein [Phycisphaerae bacterium]
MSVDRSLKSASLLSRHRNVLNREERLLKLIDAGKWEEGQNSIFGLQKVAHYKPAAGKKKKVKGPKEEEK